MLRNNYASAKARMLQTRHWNSKLLLCTTHCSSYLPWRSN